VCCKIENKIVGAHNAISPKQNLPTYDSHSFSTGVSALILKIFSHEIGVNIVDFGTK
jgi:hypothetical protein